VGAALIIAATIVTFTVFPAVVVGVTLLKPWNAVVLIGVALVFAYPLLRTSRTAVELSTDEVTIVNYVRSYRFSWPEIHRVAIGAGSAFASYGDGINLTLKQGRRELLCQASIGSESHCIEMLAAFRRFGEPWGVTVAGPHVRDG